MPKVVELFSGVGGLSLGASRAGFKLMGAVELDPITIITHQENFPNCNHLHYDVSKLTGLDICEKFNIKVGELDGLIGGPPCQGFSMMGKQNINDPRNLLFIHFFRLVKELQPSFFLAENVPGILTEKFDRIREGAFKLIRRSYEMLPPITLNSLDYGVPTNRVRIFFIGFKKGKIKPLYSDTFLSHTNNKKYTVKDAFLGLPLKVEILNDLKEIYWSKIEEPEKGSYPDLITKIIPHGIGNEEAIERLFVKKEVSGNIGTLHSKEVAERYSKIPPGKPDIISKSIRLNIDGYCPTLRAGTGRDRGSFQAVRPIHPLEGRVITPREAARIQGFPDWFQFHKTKWHSFRQIGNSVSPAIAEYILRVLFSKLA